MRINIMSLEARFTLQTKAGGGVEQFARGILVLDRQPNGVAPAAITDVVATNSTVSPRNLANRKRFRIMYDKTWPMGFTTATGSPTSRAFKLYFKFRRPIVVDYNTGNAGTVADISTNSLYWITCGNVANGATTVNGKHYFRIRFVDA